MIADNPDLAQNQGLTYDDEESEAMGNMIDSFVDNFNNERETIVISEPEQEDNLQEEAD